MDASKDGVELSRDKYQTPQPPLCDITGEICEGGRNCAMCEIAKNSLAGRSLQAAFWKFPTVEVEQRGVKFTRSPKNTVAEFKNLDDVKVYCTEKLFKEYETRNAVDLSGFVDWPDIADIVLDIYPAEYFLFLQDYPLIVVCKDRVFLAAPTFND